MLATKVDHTAVLAALGVESSASLAASAHHAELRISLEYPGFTDVMYFDADAIEIGDDIEVIGVEVGGEACCFVTANMLPPNQLVINASVGGLAVSITYGDIEDRVRVFAADQATPIPLGIGGIDVEDRLVLLLDGQRYTQCDSAVPLQEISYVRTTWSQWRHSHPSTSVCSPGRQVYGDEYSQNHRYEDLSGNESEDSAENESPVDSL